MLNRDKFSLRDKLLFEITEVEITRVDCILVFCLPFLTRGKGGAFIRAGAFILSYISYVYKTRYKISVLQK